jgi:hypothetical protein
LRKILQRCAKRFIEVIKMVKLHSSSRFLKDKVDVWGKEETMGLAEHAARLSPLVFDRRGDIVFFDDYESPTKKWVDYKDAGGVIARSIDYSTNGDFSIKATTNNSVGDDAGIEYIHTDYHDGLIGVQISVYTNWSPTILNLTLAYYDGTLEHHAQLRYYLSGYLTKIVDDAGAEQNISSTVKYYTSVTNPNFATLKLVIDTNSGDYVRALVMREEFDLSAYTIQTSASADPPHIRVRAFMTAANALAEVGYLDGFVITENEPK